MAAIFISYRQADAQAWAISLHGALAVAFGADEVFLDKDTQHAGDWWQQIEAVLSRCKVALVLIGPRWLTVADERNQPRIDSPEDTHRREVAMALQRPGLLVIPILVEEARLPKPEELPADLRALCDRQARKIGDTSWRRKADLDVLLKDIEAIGGVPRVPESGNGLHAEHPRPVRFLAMLKTSVIIVSVAIVMSVGTGICAYLLNRPLGGQELVVLAVAYCAMVAGMRSLWHRLTRQSRGRT
jgi:hypothetical protein